MDAPAPPLRSHTPRHWARAVLAHPLALLNDHAHLERKAASNALDLIQRWPFPVLLEGAGPGVTAADRWSRFLADVARDEVRHLGQVLRLLTARGGHFERAHANPYAAALRAEVRMGRGLHELLDRLLVSALIEARSGERFRVLASHADDPELRRFYAGLLASEEGHYRGFLGLARLLPSLRAHVQPRWAELLEREAAILAGLPPGPAMHSGVPAPDAAGRGA